MRFTFEEETEEETENELGGSSFLNVTIKRSQTVLGQSLIGGSFLPSDQIQEEEETPKLWGNYRGSRYLIIKDEGAYMSLASTLGGDTISVSSCNVSDISEDSTTKEKICTGNNDCRKIGLRQGEFCEPIKPSEGLLRYPRPI